MSNTNEPRSAASAVDQPATAQTTPSPINPDDHYESAKGCFMLSLYIIGSLAVCAVVGYGIHAYIEYSVN